jgi:putative acetyltransferase
VILREAGPADAAACFAIYRDAVLNGATLYTPDERRAWAPPEDDGAWMQPRLAAGRTWIAEVDGTQAGFLTAIPDGYLDFFYVRPAYRGKGVSAALYGRFLVHAEAAGHDMPATHASHHARRFLERRGWSVVEKEIVTRNGVPLTRWRMTLVRSR